MLKFSKKITQLHHVCEGCSEIKKEISSTNKLHNCIISDIAMII